MMNDTIMTPTLVIKWGDLKLPFSPCTFSELYNIELKEARLQIGCDLWEAMVAARADYSEELPYQGETNYTAGDVVLFRGAYHRAKVDTNRIPSLVSDWEPAPYFIGDCGDSFNDFFCKLLGPYLSKVVVLEKLPFIIQQIGDGGIEYAGRKYNLQDEKMINTLKATITRQKNDIWDNIEYWFSRQAIRESECFSPYVANEETICGCGGSGCSTCNPKSNRPTTNPGWYDIG